MPKKPRPFDPHWHHTKAAVAMSANVICMLLVGGVAVNMTRLWGGNWWPVAVIMCLHVFALVWMFSLIERALQEHHKTTIKD